MKNAISILVLFFISLSVNAQLTGTKWKGKVNIPQLTDVTLDFKDNIATVKTTTGMPVESCSYTIKADTITFIKPDGGSPCPVNSVFTVQYAVNSDKLIINPLTDDCEGRKGSFSKEPFIKIKD